MTTTSDAITATTTTLPTMRIESLREASPADKDAEILRRIAAAKAAMPASGLWSDRRVVCPEIDVAPGSYRRPIL